MTETDSARPRPRPLRLRRTVLSLLAAVMTIGLSVPAHAATTAASDPVVVHTAAAGSGVLDVDTPLTVSVHAANPSTDTTGPSRVTVSYSPTALTNRAEVLAWLAGNAPAAGSHELGAVGMEPLDAGAQSTAELTLDPATSDNPEVQALAELPPGVYPLWSQLTRGTTVLTSVSTFTVADTDAAAPLGVVVPLTAPPQTAGLISADDLSTLTADGGSLRAQLEAVTGTGAILAVDPAIVASIRVLGASAPASATTWLADLLALPNTRFALQFGDTDLAAQIGAGLQQPLVLDALSAEVSAEATPAPTPTPSEDPGPADDLMSIGAAVPAVAWPATGTAGATVAAALAASGTALTLLPASVAGGVSDARADAGDAHLLIYDDAVSAALNEASVTEQPVARSRALATATALASFTGSAPLLVTVDRAATRTEDALHESIVAALTLPGRTAVGLGDLAATAPATATLSDVSADAARVDALTSFLADETEVAQFATVLADPVLLTSRQRAAVLQVMGNGWLGTPGFGAAVEAHREATAATLTSVAIIPPSGMTLAASSAALGFSVRNELPWPVSVQLSAVPHDLRLVVQRTTDVEAAPRQNTRAEVPVEARVGNGESGLTLQLRSPAGVVVGDPITVDISVRAEWESVGVAVMAVLVVGLIVFGIVRTIRRRRGARQPAGE